MAYHDELLSQVLQLVHVTPPTQLTLRRAVSAAYYAVFHFLIAEATSNWSNAPLRTSLGRAYDHGVMKTASNRILNAKDFPFTGEDPVVVANLRFVAQAFSQLTRRAERPSLSGIIACKACLRNTMACPAHRSRLSPTILPLPSNNIRRPAHQNALRPC